MQLVKEEEALACVKERRFEKGRVKSASTCRPTASGGTCTAASLQRFQPAVEGVQKSCLPRSWIAETAALLKMGGQPSVQALHKGFPDGSVSKPQTVKPERLSSNRKQGLGLQTTSGEDAEAEIKTDLSWQKYKVLRYERLVPNGNLTMPLAQTAEV